MCPRRYLTGLFIYLVWDYIMIIYLFIYLFGVGLYNDTFTWLSRRGVRGYTVARAGALGMACSPIEPLVGDHQDDARTPLNVYSFPTAFTLH
jgi:hypothetical protein